MSERMDKQAEQYFPDVKRLLEPRIGKEKAITIADITETVGIHDRRITEHLLETRLRSFGFLLVAGAHGYYRPTEAKEINTYRGSLHQRHRKMQRREETVVHMARIEGWPEQGEDFVNPPDHSPELFAMHRPSNTQTQGVPA